jgi:DNA-binding MarR family transcriptional regulator
MSRFSPDIDRERIEQASGQRGGAGSSTGELASIIDQSAAGAPTFSEFLRRLESRGVKPLPSVNVRGLNGMSYQFRGETFKGSDIGRAYTAQGLQDRKGVQYSPERDLAGIRTAALERPAGGRTRDVRTGISADQLATISEIGKFRTIGVHDLIEHRYEGKYGQFAQDVRVLREAGLIERRTAVHAKSGKTYDVIVLTPKGRRAARTAAIREGSEQQFYSGLVKSAEIRHDIGIYRMYQRERAEIEAAGGKVTRVAMDFEIKKQLMSELNRRGEDPRDMQRKVEIARRHDIEIVNGRFVIPDLRVEYQTREGESLRVDLELATGDYKPAQIAAKRAAGLKIYGPDSTPGGAPRDFDYAAGTISI